MDNEFFFTLSVGSVMLGYEISRGAKDNATQRKMAGALSDRLSNVREVFPERADDLRVARKAVDVMPPLDKSAAIKLMIELTFAAPFGQTAVKVNSADLIAALKAVAAKQDLTGDEVMHILSVRDQALAAHKAGNDWWKAGLGLAGGMVLLAPLAFVAAPIIGTVIGVSYLGLAGAAATSAGLALLGGGSLAAGGMGMAGGAWLIAGLGAAAGAAAGGGAGLLVQKLGSAELRQSVIMAQMTHQLVTLEQDNDLEAAEAAVAALEERREPLFEEQRRLRNDSKPDILQHKEFSELDKKIESLGRGITWIQERTRLWDTGVAGGQ